MNNGTNNSRKFSAISKYLGVLIDIILVLGLLVTWIGCLGRWHWFLSLFDHFRIQGAIVCLVALVVLVWRRRWWLVGLAAVSLAINVMPLLKTSGTLSTTIVAHPQLGLKIVSLNVLTSNQRYADTLAYLQGTNADVILLLEVNAAWEQSLMPLRKTHPHGTSQSRQDNFGIALYSRLPLEEFQVTSFVDQGMPSIATIITVGERKIRLVGTHPLPPHNADTLSVQFAQLQAIGQFVSATPDVPAIVLGDFNATPWSPAINELRAKSTLDFRCRNAVWLPTWQVRTPLALPIDLALCTPPLFFEQRDIGPEVGSDHRAQVLQIRWAISP